MLVDVKCGELEFELVVACGKMIIRPRLVHCHICGWLWFPDTALDPDYCAKCKAPAYNKFPDEFDVLKTKCSICRFEYEFILAISGEVQRTTLKRKEPWQPHPTPMKRLQELFSKKAS